MDPNAPDPQATRPRQLTDLPNELIAKMFKYLVPDEHLEYNPLRNPIRREPKKMFISGWDKFIVLDDWIDGVDSQVDRTHIFANYLRREGLRMVKVDQKPVQNTSSSTKSFASLATTCRRFSEEARRWYTQRTFSMTVSNYGVTFENLGDNMPQRVFSVIPKDLSHIESSFATFDVRQQKVVRIPKTTIPENIALDVFSRALQHLRSLNLHVDLDLDPTGNGKTHFFLSQIGRHLLSSPYNTSSLSKIDIAVNVGLHRANSEDAVVHGRSAARIVAGPCVHLRQDQCSPSGSLHDCVLPNLSTVLRSLITSLVRLRSRQNNSRKGCDNSRAKDGSPLAIRILVHGDSTPALMTWGRSWGLLAHVSRPSDGHSAGDVYMTFLTCGEFEPFCSDLQHRLFPARRTVPNTMVDPHHLICEIGLPIAKDSAASVPKSKKRGRNAEQDEIIGNEGEVSARDATRRRLH